MDNYRAQEYLLNAARLRQIAQSTSSDINRAELCALAIKWEDLARTAAGHPPPAALPSEGSKM